MGAGLFALMGVDSFGRLCYGRISGGGPGGKGKTKMTTRKFFAIKAPRDESGGIDFHQIGTDLLACRMPPTAYLALMSLVSEFEALGTLDRGTRYGLKVGMGLIASGRDACLVGDPQRCAIELDNVLSDNWNVFWEARALGQPHAGAAADENDGIDPKDFEDRLKVALDAVTEKWGCPPTLVQVGSSEVVH